MTKFSVSRRTFVEGGLGLTVANFLPGTTPFAAAAIAVPKGYRVALSVRGRDYVYPGGSGGKLSNMKNEFTGNGPFLHDDTRDRPLEIYGGKTTIHLGGSRENFVLLPIIPARAATKTKAKTSKPV